jgi:hypothetical protein
MLVLILPHISSLVWVCLEFLHSQFNAIFIIFSFTIQFELLEHQCLRIFEMTGDCRGRGEQNKSKITEIGRKLKKIASDAFKMVPWWSQLMVFNMQHPFLSCTNHHVSKLFKVAVVSQKRGSSPVTAAGPEYIFLSTKTEKYLLGEVGG